MIEGQAKAFEKDSKTPAAVSENINVPANLHLETKTADVIEIRVRKIYQLNRRKRIGKSKSSRIL